MIALQLSEDRISFTERRNQIIDSLHALPAQIKKILELDQSIQELAATVSSKQSLLLMGRGYQFVESFFVRLICLMPDTRLIVDTRLASRVL